MKYRILNILPFLPWPLTTGGHNGCYHSIEAMKNLVDLYVLFPFANNQKDIEYMKNYGRKLLGYLIKENVSLVEKQLRELDLYMIEFKIIL